MVIIEILENWCACSCMWNVWLLLVGLVFESFVCLVLDGTCFLDSHVCVDLWGCHFDVQLGSYWKKKSNINILLVPVISHYLKLNSWHFWSSLFSGVVGVGVAGILLLSGLAFAALFVSRRNSASKCFFFCFCFCRALTIKSSREGICVFGWAS